MQQKEKKWINFPLLALISTRSERPDEWVPAETALHSDGNRTRDKYSEIHEVDEDRNGNIVDIFSIHAGNTGNPC